MGTITTKSQYIERIRSESAYPAFRTLINVFAVLLYICGGLSILVSLGYGIFMMKMAGGGGMGAVTFVMAMVIGVVAGLFYIVIGKVFKEAASMLADVADSLTDLNSRYEQQQQ